MNYSDLNEPQKRIYDAVDSFFVNTNVKTSDLSKVLFILANKYKSKKKVSE